MTTILGLNSGEFNSSACVLKNGKIIFSVQEERLNREKFTKKFPTKSISECLKYAKIDLKKIDFVSIGWNPSMHMSRFNPLLSGQRIFREHNFYSISDNLFNLTPRDFGNYTFLKHNNKNFPGIYHVNHHCSHAANTFYLSNFNKAAILTCDFKGENQCTTWGMGFNNKIKILKSQNMPNSLGMFYATFTSILGYKPDSDEWKVMAMSGYNYDCKEYITKLRKTYKLLKNGELELIAKYFSYSNQGNSNSLYTKELMNLLNVKNVSYRNSPTKNQIKIAKALQFCAEEIAVHFLNHLYKITKCKNVALSGGFFMNSVFNGKIVKKTKFENSYIPHSPTDVGNSIGSALYLYYNILNKKKIKLKNTAYLGPEFSNNKILQALKKRNIKYYKINNFAKVVAEKCFEGQIVAFFRNRLEFGDRALGCRSILADPRFNKMKQKINNSIKYRESYRPFAPAVIDEKKHLYFEISRKEQFNYMEKVVKVKKNCQKKLQAITHLDGSARVQTVDKKDNKDFYNILKEFEKLSNFPILLNTSFNINGEPIVCSPDDALNTFFNSQLDVLIIGDYMIRK